MTRAPLPVRIVKWLALLAMLAYVTHLLTSGTDEIVSRPAVENSAATMLSTYADRCWQGEAPADVVAPGHVLWVHPDGETVYSSDLVGPALDATFGDGKLPGRPLAFCY